jgi:hypothetical protein
MPIIIAGCVDPGFIFMFLVMVVAAVVAGVCGFFMPYPPRLIAAWISLASGIGVMTVLIHDGALRDESGIFSVPKLIMFGPFTLGLASLIRCYAFRRSTKPR